MARNHPTIATRKDAGVRRILDTSRVEVGMAQWHYANLLLSGFRKARRMHPYPMGLVATSLGMMVLSFVPLQLDRLPLSR